MARVESPESEPTCTTAAFLDIAAPPKGRRVAATKQVAAGQRGDETKRVSGAAKIPVTTTGLYIQLARVNVKQNRTRVARVVKPRPMGVMSQLGTKYPAYPLAMPSQKVKRGAYHQQGLRRTTRRYPATVAKAIGSSTDVRAVGSKT